MCRVLAGKGGGEETARDLKKNFLLCLAVKGRWKEVFRIKGRGKGYSSGMVPATSNKC